MYKRKIINDPVYGLIEIPYGIVFEVIEHPYFQRLRRVKQLGLSHYVYPGATHTRFEHVLGAMHLMTLAVASLRGKGVEISDDEELGVVLAILLHDVGHGPFSHTLERQFVEGSSHEVFTLLIMRELNVHFGGKLATCIAIFENRYPKKFLHQLVSSQLDMDRLDYLGRDSFYTGVSEGVVGADRIIKMLTLHNDQLAVEAKGIYSIENFLISRRLMYWQVYLHKTVLVSEKLLTHIVHRAKALVQSGRMLFATPALNFFLSRNFSALDVLNSDDSDGITDLVRNFAAIDDTDILSAIKVWASDEDRVLSFLSGALINRRFFRIEIQEHPFDEERVANLRIEWATKLGVDVDLAKYLVFTGSVSNHAYSIKSDQINILYKDGREVDVSKASDMFNISVLSRNVKKYYLSEPKL
ncbi:MAG: hypothetical protein RIS47_1374 [Bacteroidota bacterium]